MLNDKRAHSQSVTYKVLYYLFLVMIVVGSVFSMDLYFNEYNTKLEVFENCPSLYAYNILSIIVAGFCIVVLFMPKLFSCAKNDVKPHSLLNVFASSFCGIFCIAYPVLLVYEKSSGFGSIDKMTLLTAVISFAASFYFFMQMFGAENKNLSSIFGMIFSVFCIIIIFTVHYGSSDILITSPVRISSLLSYISIMLFILSEVRYYIGRQSHSMHFSMGVATMYFSLTSSLPKLYLSVIGENGFELTSKTVLLAIELFVGIYATVHLSRYLSSKEFSASKSIDEETEEIYEMLTVIGNESIDTSENISEELETASENEYYFENDSLIVSENDLPEDVGFDGGKEGAFVVEDYESIENDDDDFDADEISPFEEESLEDSIRDAIDENNDDLAELINYEEIKSSVEESQAETYEHTDNNDLVTNGGVKEETIVDIYDDDELDDEIDRIIDELVHKHDIEKEQANKEGTKRSKFKFVKKM